MKILRMPSYCYPEQVSSSHLSSDLTEALIKNGYEFEVFAPTPSRGLDIETIKKYKKIKYEELYEGKLKLHRFKIFNETKNPILRAIRYILINIIQYNKAIKVKDVDLIYCGSTPPTQGLLCSKVRKKLEKKFKKKIPFIYNLQDIFPESLVTAKLTKKGSLIWKIGRKMENYIYKNSDKIIVISEDFKSNLLLKNVPECKIEIIPNWIDTNKVVPIEREKNILFEELKLDRNKFYLTYCGNIGMSQNIDLIIEAAIFLKDANKNINFVFFGEGVCKNQLKEKIDYLNLNNIYLFPFMNYEQISLVFSLGNVGLIISKPGTGNNSVPSKTWSYLSAGIPILASFEENTNLAKLLINEDCGKITSNIKSQEFIHSIIYMYNNNYKNIEMGKKGRNFVINNLNKDVCTNKYINIFGELLKNVKGEIKENNFKGAIDE